VDEVVEVEDEEEVEDEDEVEYDDCEAAIVAAGMLTRRRYVLG